LVPKTESFIENYSKEFWFGVVWQWLVKKLQIAVSISITIAEDSVVTFASIHFNAPFERPRFYLF